MLEDLNNFYLNKTEPQKSVFMALREIIINFDPEITEAWKYRMPCFCYKGKPFCYLWKDKVSGAPYLLVVKGGQIDHPLLVQGNRAKMKILPIDVDQDLPINEITEVLAIAKALY